MPTASSISGAGAWQASGGEGSLAWLLQGGRNGRLIAAHDWRSTSLGPIESWNEALVRTVQLCLDSSFPLALLWGADYTLLYNDAFVGVAQDHAPSALGQRFRDAWASAWPLVRPYVEEASRGHSSHVTDGRLLLDRNGTLEEAFVTFSFSPVRAADRREVAGVLLTIIETTSKVRAERRARLLRHVAAAGVGAGSIRDALRATVGALGGDLADVPFAAAYLVEGEENLEEPVAKTPTFPDGCSTSPSASTVLAEVARSGRSQVTSVSSDSVLTPAMVLRVTTPGAAAPCALLLAGLGPCLPLDREYQAFLDQLSSTLAASIAGAQAHEEQRKRADELSALDRAKTAFFANVSHELRTPLTLLAGPLEDELAEDPPLPEPRRERLLTARRNAQRLIKLVNVLLDFSRFEAGRALARYRPTDVGALTSELTSMFRSALERVGLKLEVEIEPEARLVYVDREMWEKIVLNLMSNAFKHTFQGGVRVTLGYSPTAAELRVTDTGIGIDERELPQLFERFHRVVGAQSRTHEGTGIGLALVRELSRLHGGDVSVTSQRGVGTTFLVSVPLGCDHLPSEHIDRTPTERPAGVDVAAYVQEALLWSRTPEEGRDDSDAARHDLPKVLVADDNADMRSYISGLLGGHCRVVTVADGLAALELLPTFKPDLVLTDVMMPRLDGAGLLRALRARDDTRVLPVVLLSARAEAEAATAGLEAGADDYLVKPFSARELLARVRTHVELSRARRAWAKGLEETNEELEAFSYSVSHDLRTPLRAIDGFSKAILTRKAEQLDEEGKQYLARVRKAAARMGELIDDLLNLSRVSRAPLQRRAVSLSALAAEVVQDLEDAEPLRGVDCEVESGIMVHADGRLLRVVLENLLGNSWKFTAQRARANVRVGQVPAAQPPTYFVADNGAGFEETYPLRLFQPFQRLHAEADYAGTGVGLAIVHRIVSRHGGRVWAEGRENQGATFYFTLASKT